MFKSKTCWGSSNPRYCAVMLLLMVVVMMVVLLGMPAKIPKMFFELVNYIDQMRWIIKEFLWEESTNANKCRNKQIKKRRLDRDIIVTRYQPLYNPSLSVSPWQFFTALMLNNNVKYQLTFFINCICILYFQPDWHHLSNISRFAWKMLSFVILCCWEHGTISYIWNFLYIALSRKIIYILNYTF